MCLTRQTQEIWNYPPSPSQWCGRSVWFVWEEGLELGASLEISDEYASLDQAESAVDDGDLDGILTVEADGGNAEASLHHDGDLVVKMLPAIQWP